MFSKRKVYCVFGCSELGAYMHRFPHPEKRAKLFATWLIIVQEKLKESDPMKIYKNKRICDYHFQPADRTTEVASHRLIDSAVPSLHLTGVHSSSGISVHLEHNYSLPRMWLKDNNLNPNITVSSSQNVNIVDKELHPAPEVNLDNLHSTSQASMKDHNRRAPVIPDYVKKTKIEMLKLKRKLNISVQKTKSFKARLANAQKSITGQALHIITKNMSSAERIFTGMQYKQALKAAKGRRFTLEEKIMALTFFKKSPKCYTLLYKYFKLPSSKTLRNLLSQIKICPGENKVIYAKLKETVQAMNEEDRLCTLIFDEMSLTPNIQYDAANDELKGFITTESEMKIANHALVFMVKGIKMSFKQPVAYYFPQNLNKIQLKNTITNVIRNVNSTGLKIVCSVCDQGASNVSAINSLVDDTKAKYLRKGKEWRHEMYEIDTHQIIHLYDVPHLLKGLRNNLLTKHLKYTDFRDENKIKTVKWEYFQMLYEADKSYGELRYLHKLTEEHVNPEKIKKMRVKMAAQVFSHSVAVATEHITARKMLPDECRQLIPVVLLLDKLFDSFNAGTFNIPNGKVYRGSVKRNTVHHKLWQESIIFLKHVKFITKKKEGNKIRLVETTAPS